MGNGQTKEEKKIQEQATKETLLECPVLLDLKHGTIRHRHEERLNDIENEKAKMIQIGYFYHPRLNDFSEDADITKSTDNRLKYVYKGPPKDTGKKLYYIYGTKVSDSDQGIKHEYRPQGKGYNWPESYRKANSLYYDVSFVKQDETNVIEEDIDPKISDNISDGVTIISAVTSNLSSISNKDMFTLKLRACDTVAMVAERISLQLLIPACNISLMYEKNILSGIDQLGDFRNEDDRIYPTFYIQLKIT